MTTSAANPPIHDSWAEELAHLVFHTRLESGVTQAELAHAVGVSQSTVDGWEQGTSVPDVKTLDAVARACGQRLEIIITKELIALPPDE